MLGAEPRAVATGCKHSILKAAPTLISSSTVASGRYAPGSAMVALPTGRDVYRTRDRQKILLAPAERKHTSDLPANVGTIALRWSASFRVQSIFYINISLRWSETLPFYSAPG